MRTHRGHWTRTDPHHVRAAIGTNEKRLKSGEWLKVSGGQVFRGNSRTEVRNAAKAT